MARVLIICPTFDHQDTLYPTLESVRRQTFQDFEVVVVGDGAPARTAQIMSDITARDPRFRYEWHPKHTRMGEPHRDALIRASTCELVAYIADDDLWMPQHLEWLVGGLEDHDFAHSMHYMLHLDGHVQAIPFQFASPRLRQLAIARATWCFGLSFAAHTRSAYMQLEAGWATTPEGIPTDLNMWAKFAALPGVRCWELLFPTALHLHAGLRTGMSPEARADDAWQTLQALGKEDFSHTLIARASFAQHFAYLFNPTTSAHLKDVDEVLAFHGLKVHRLGFGEALAQTPEAGVLYCDPNALRAVDIQWRAHAGHVEHAQIRTEYEALLARTPLNHDARAALAELHTGKQEAARGLALTAPFHPQTTAKKYLVVRAKAQLALGLFSDAVALIDTLLLREPDDPYLHHHRGRALAGTGDDDGALLALQHALSLRDALPWTHLLTARLLVARREIRAAANHVRAARGHGAPASAADAVEVLIAGASAVDA